MSETPEEINERQAAEDYRRQRQEAEAVRRGDGSPRRDATLQWIRDNRTKLLEIARRSGAGDDDLEAAADKYLNTLSELPPGSDHACLRVRSSWPSQRHRRRHARNPRHAHSPLGGLMRLEIGSILVISSILGASPAPAQTYDPRYPVCMEVYSIDGSAIGCGYTTMAQCLASASGRAAQCFVNPYFAGANRKRPVRAHRRHES